MDFRAGIIYVGRYRLHFGSAIHSKGQVRIWASAYDLVDPDNLEYGSFDHEFITEAFSVVFGQPCFKCEKVNAFYWLGKQP